jgi:DNA topoisomerase-3
VRGRELPPLPFSASVLASTAAKRFGMTPKEAERAAQSLYERHKAISYVGTDCQYLPQSLADDARATLQMLARMYPQQASGANPELRSKAWDDSKVQEHYAIIPTGRLPETASVPERQVYDTVVKRYLAQFYPAHEFIRHQLGVLFGQDEFRSSRRDVTRQGWREVEGDLEMGGRDAQPEESETDDDVAVDGRQAHTSRGRH